MKKRETNYEKTTIKRKTTNFSNVGIQERKKIIERKKKHKILTQINLKKEREKNHHT